MPRSFEARNSGALRIVVVISSLGGGGAERVAVDLCRHWLSEERYVALITLSGDDPDVLEAPTGVQRVRIDIRQDARSWPERILFTLRHLRRMRKRVLELQPDIVVSFVDQTNVRIIACLVGTGISIVVSERSYPGKSQLSRSWVFARRLLYRLADAVVAQTGESAEWLRQRVKTKRLEVLPNAVRALHDMALPDNRPIDILPSPFVVGVGRLGSEKGFDLLLDAFQRSGISEAGWRLAILGGGKERAMLLAQAKALGLQEVLTMPGHVRNIRLWLEAADIFVLSSRFEGFPNALLEAMQLGRPCISFDCVAGPKDIIRNETDGLLVPAEDVSGLASALRRLADDSELRTRLGAAGRAVNERLSRDRIYGRWSTLVDEVARPRQPERAEQPRVW